MKIKNPSINFIHNGKILRTYYEVGLSQFNVPNVGDTIQFDNYIHNKDVNKCKIIKCGIYQVKERKYRFCNHETNDFVSVDIDIYLNLISENLK